METVDTNYPKDEQLFDYFFFLVEDINLKWGKNTVELMAEGGKVVGIRRSVTPKRQQDSKIKQLSELRSRTLYYEIEPRTTLYSLFVRRAEGEGWKAGVRGYISSQHLMRRWM